jgi:hypothetical protein
MGLEGDKQQKVSESELLTIAFIANEYFHQIIKKLSTIS